MKAVAAFLLLGCMPPAVSAAAPDHVQFVGTVQQEGHTPVVLDLQLPSTQAATLRLSDGVKLELVAPGNAASPEGARIRLVSPDGTIMHTATVPDRSLASTSFIYLVCAGEVTYISPAPAVVPSCGA